MLFLSKNIRTLLTVKYTIVVALLMLMYSAVNLGYQYYYLSKQVDLNLKEDLEIIQEILLTNDVIINPLETISDHQPKPYERFVEIWSDSGKVLYHSSAFKSLLLPAPPNSERYTVEPHYFSLQFPSGEKWRTIGVIVVTPRGYRIVRISMSEEHLFNQLMEIFRFMSFLTPLFLIGAIITGYFLARQALKPIDTMVAQVKKIGMENLRNRLTIINPNDELGNLAGVMNELLERIQRSFDQLKNFTSDASHELRTPLTVMRSVGEVGLQDGQSPEYYREVIGSMLEENSRLTHLVDSLLFLSRTDAEKLTLKKESFDLLEFSKECSGVIVILAEEKQQTLTINGESGIIVYADKTLLRQAFLNLIDNAIKYTQPSGSITITVSQLNSSHARIEVKDTGTEIPLEYHGKIFDRFYRVNKDRSRETGGAGLGLSIVHWIMDIHQGNVTLQSSVKGNIFILEFPTMYS
ncbi:MAG: ATP-binding protein [Bacteroidota bacterium]|nr:ATP-binding protein [Bacteroidota bacterium]